MKIQYILHADFELPGVIETWAKQNHFNENFCRPYANEKLPGSDEFDFLILMGGPQSPLNLANAPYLKDEIDLIQKCLEAQIPLLGFCLGAQLIGEAFGARTEKSPNKEVGVFPITLTDEGKQDPILKNLPSQFHVVHWHNDMPGLTKESKILAASEGCPRQIVRYSSLAYGFQCHPEPTKQNIEEMIRCCPEDLKPGPYVQTAQELLSYDYKSINQMMLHILDNLILSKFSVPFK